MPILVIQCCCVMDNQIRFKFLKKPVSNPLLLISKDSALSSEVLPWAVKAEILSEFSHKLECSGWDENSRYALIMAGLTGYSWREPRLGSAPCVALGIGIVCIT